MINAAEFADTPKGQPGRPSKSLTLQQSAAVLKASHGTRIGAYIARRWAPASAPRKPEPSRNRMVGATAFRYLASLDGLVGGITEERVAEFCQALTDGHLYRPLAVSAAGAPPNSADGFPTTSRRHCCLPERAATPGDGRSPFPR